MDNKKVYMDNKKVYMDNKKVCLELNHPYCITPYLKGGIGNNLFQIAASYSYSLDNKCQFIIEDFKKPGPGHKQVKISNIPDTICEMFPNVPCVNEIKYIWTTYTKQKRKMKYINIPLQLYVRKNERTKLIGVFASYIYFKNHSEEVKKLFQYSPEIIKYIRSNFENIVNNDKTVSLHVRRGDKVRLIKSGQDIFCIPGIDYYQKAISYFKNDNMFVIFNEEIDNQWIESNIIPILEKGKYKYIRIRNQPAIIDMALISYCHNNIINNSTFGFWGAFLNMTLNPTIIAPQVWKRIKDPYEIAVKMRGDLLSVKEEERLPPNWIQIETECDEDI
jgi:hypothetical protein